ncbi:MAG: hypothetical protein R3205_09415, partial [Psychrobacter sp.]|nr:hypothetical protein [Psychrobacter sp.]
MNMSVSKKHFVRITTWDDIFKMSRYTDSLDPKKEKLKQVINKYELPNKGRCGLSNCRTPHNIGCIVETESGRLTNLGNVCGKKYFGDNFTSLSNKLSKEIDYFNKVENIKLAKSNITENYRKLSEIEADWKKIEGVYKTIKSEGLDGLYDKLEQMKYSKSSSISIQRRATKSEIELEEVRTGKDVQNPFYISEILGDLKGLNYLVDRIKIKAMILNNKIILESLEKFDEENIAFKDLNKMTKDNERLKDSIY